jgi:hypothetical protein
LTYAPSSRAGGFVSDKTSASKGHVVEKINIRRLDDITLGHVDFVKIDVEGFEAHVLRGGGNCISVFKPVVTLELNHWCLNAFQRTSVPDFLDFLRAVFPILLAVEGDTYLDLHLPDQSYAVMYHHILHMKYVALVGVFDDNRLQDFRSRYAHKSLST